MDEVAHIAGYRAVIHLMVLIGFVRAVGFARPERCDVFCSSTLEGRRCHRIMTWPGPVIEESAMDRTVPMSTSGREVPRKFLRPAKNHRQASHPSRPHDRVLTGNQFLRSELQPDLR